MLALFWKLVNKGEESSIHLAVNMSISSGNQFIEEGKFLFIETIQVISEEGVSDELECHYFVTSNKIMDLGNELQ